MALERLKRKATELFYGPKTYMPPRKRLIGKVKSKVIMPKRKLKKIIVKKKFETIRTKAAKQQLKNSGLSDAEIARFMK